MSFTEPFVIHIHVNGEHANRTLAALAHHIPAGVPVFMSASPLADKVTAIRHGADVALDARSDVLVVVDNDVLLPEGSLGSLITAFRTSASESACATKAPLTGPWSSAFQVIYSYAVQESFRHNLFPKRPTGSFYAVNPAIVRDVLTPGFAEGDILAQIKAKQSALVVWSPYANDFRSEVRRRVRHLGTSEMNGFSRLHSNSQFISEAKLIHLPDSADRNWFVASMKLWHHVHETASKLAVRDQGGLF